jgi:hypothetical protein
MTEAEWLACADPRPMLEFLGDQASARKLRLFAVACCRRSTRLLGGNRAQEVMTQEVIRTAEQFVEGLADAAALRAAQALANGLAVQAWRVADRSGRSRAEHAVAHAISSTILCCCPFDTGTFGAEQTCRIAALAAAGHRPQEPQNLPDIEAESVTQTALLRDIFGPLPVRPVAVDPRCLRWNYGTVPAIARHIYDERAFHDLPILADALDDAGCTNADILTHCRSEGPHVRGCWVVDLLLGKE